MLFRPLILALIGVFLIYFMVLARRSAIKRLFLTFFFGTGAAFVLWPNLTNRLAWLVGIGRGADLVFYVSIVFLFFLLFNIYLHFATLAANQSLLVRELALRSPLQVSGAGGAPNDLTRTDGGQLRSESRRSA